EFERLRDEYLELQKEFEGRFPEANEALHEIQKLQDAIQAAIDRAKPLVREAGQTINDFVYQPKSTNPNYDGEKLLKIIDKRNADEAGELFKTLVDLGLLKALVVDQSVAQVFRTTNEEMAKQIESAWDKGGPPLTAVIFTPKI